MATIADINIAMQLVSRLDLERRESQQREADEANKKFIEAQAEIIKDARVKEIKADQTRTDYDKDIHIEGLNHEKERLAGKGRFKALLEKYGDALKTAAEHNDTAKFLYENLSEYIAMNEQWGSDVCCSAETLLYPDAFTPPFTTAVFSVVVNLMAHYKMKRSTW